MTKIPTPINCPNDQDISVSELRYRRLFETAQDGILLIDFKTGMILDANKFLIDLLGYSKTTFLQKHLWEVGVFKDVAASKRNFLTIQKRGYVRFEDLPLETKAGKKIAVEFIANSYRVGDATIIQCNVRDITARKQAEYIAQVSELRYRRLFETAQDGILLIDFKTGMILDANKFLIDLLGYSKEMFLQKRLWEVGLFKDVAASKRNFVTLQQRRYVRFEDLPLETKAGKKIDVEFVANAYQVDGETIIQCNIRDITDRKRAEDALKESEEKFSKAFAISPHAITITRASDGTFIEANSAFNTMMGYSAAEIAASSTVGLKIWAHPEDRKKVIANLRAGQPVVNQEYQFRTKHGEMITGLFSAQTIQLSPGLCLLSSVANISDRKRAEALVEEIKTRDEAILNSIGDAVFACDKDGIILLFNQMAADMTGIPIKEAIGHHYHDTITFIKESNGKPCDDCIAKAIKSHVITKMANHVMLVRQDGRRIPVADSAAPIRDAAGEVMGCVVVFHDVTRERQIDKAKTEFVSLASHQLRTPLSTINWYVEMLLSLDVGQLTAKQRQYSEEVYHASQRMVNLVNSLLNVSRLELGTLAVDPELVDITKIAATCLKDLRPLILKKKLAVTEKYDKKITKVKADPKLLAMIFENFLSNSVKYTNPGGKIELTIKEDKAGIQIAVTDNGIGIPQCQQAEICSKLFRADNAKQLDPDGTGLGLYIVKEIVNYTGGQIGFTSQEGKGSTFYANLPLAGMTKKTGSKGLV